MRICLNLIVKNEEGNIIRCLESFNKIKFRNAKGELEEAIKAIAILDTGSTDKTIELVENWVREKGKEGGILSKPWKENYFHFAINRNLALEYAYEVIHDRKGWYILFTDADNMIQPSKEGEEIIIPADLDKDRYLCEFRTGGCHSTGNLMVRFDKGKGWCWIGGVHEYLTHKDPQISSDILPGLWMDARCEGCRSQNEFKYVRDVKYLKTLIAAAEKYKVRKVKGIYEDEEASSIVRYHFYLAQSLRDSGLDMEKQSEEMYLKRAKMGDWFQEVYICYIEAYKRRLLRRGKVDRKAALYLEKAFDTDPERLEAPYYYIKYLNAKKRFRQSWNFCKPLLKLEKDLTKLFVESYIYDYAFLDEAAVAAFYGGDKQIAKLLFEKILDRAPEHCKQRINTNIALCG